MAPRKTKADPAADSSEGQAEVETARFPVLSPVRFDGQLYRPDDPEADEVTMPVELAEPLVQLGVLGEALA